MAPSRNPPPPKANSSRQPERRPNAEVSGLNLGRITKSRASVSKRRRPHPLSLGSPAFSHTFSSHRSLSGRDIEHISLEADIALALYRSEDDIEATHAKLSRWAAQTSSPHAGDIHKHFDTTVSPPNSPHTPSYRPLSPRSK